jgi:hypothetical protein
MKTKAMVLVGCIVVAAVAFAIFYQRHRYKEAVQSLAIVQRMIPGRTQIEEVKEAFRRDFSGNGNCPGGTCAFTRSFDNTWLGRLILRKSLSFVVEVSAEGGVVTNTSASLKIVGPDSWVGAAVLRSQYTPCQNPESSCTFVNVGEDRRIPIRVVSMLPADPLSEVKQPAYAFDLKCLLPFCRCTTIDDIYPEWKQLQDLTTAAAEFRR